MKNNKETITQKMYDLLKESISVLNKLPRDFKFTIGDRIQNTLSDLLEIYIQAYYYAKTKKLPLLQEANIQLEIARYYFRLCFDLGLINSRKYQAFAEKLHEIGKMTGGWIKSLEK